MYKTHRTEGSVVPVAVRHVSPKNPCCRKGRREGNIGEPPGERNQGERRPAGEGGGRVRALTNACACAVYELCSSSSSSGGGVWMWLVRFRGREM